MNRGSVHTELSQIHCHIRMSLLYLKIHFSMNNPPDGVVPVEHWQIDLLHRLAEFIYPKGS